MTKRQIRNFQKQLRRKPFPTNKPLETALPAALVATSLASTTPMLSPQDESILRELRAFASDINTVLLAVEQRFHARALVAGLRTGTDQFAK